jgi:DNA-binding response OmpR family regulator
MLKKVFVLDDDLATLDAIREVLTYAGFEVKSSNTPHGIFNLIEDFKPHVIMVDYLLHSSVTGGDICRQIKLNLATSHIPVIILSAYSRTIINSLGNSGCDNFIAKPFDLSDLVDTLNNTIDFRVNIANTYNQLPNVYM